MPKKYGVIYADPAVRFKTYSEKGEGKSASRHYDVMNTQEICALPIGDMAANDCALFIWSTWPHIFHTEQIIKAWGFTYSGLAWEWIKYNDATEKFSFGNGYGTRKNVEPLLLARKGKPELLSKSVRDFLFSPRREHSRKPDACYERIERMYRGPYIELFARQRWPGWDAWGNEVDKFTGAAA